MRDEKRWIESCVRFYRQPPDPADADLDVRPARRPVAQRGQSASLARRLPRPQRGRARAFRDAPPGQFLELDLVRRPRWDELCAFLDEPVPRLPLPHANPTRAGRILAPAWRARAARARARAHAAGRLSSAGSASREFAAAAHAALRWPARCVGATHVATHAPRRRMHYLLSFPKVGRTWVRVMLGQLLAEHFGVPELVAASLRDRDRCHRGVPRIVVRARRQPASSARRGASTADRREYAGTSRDPADPRPAGRGRLELLPGHASRALFEGDLATWLRCAARLGRLACCGITTSGHGSATCRRVPAAALRGPARGRAARAATHRRVHRPARRERGGHRARRALELRAMRRREAARPADGIAAGAGHAGDPESFKARRARWAATRVPAADDVAWLAGRIARARSVLWLRIAARTTSVQAARAERDEP